MAPSPRRATEAGTEERATYSRRAIRAAVAFALAATAALLLPGQAVTQRSVARDGAPGAHVGVGSVDAGSTPEPTLEEIIERYNGVIARERAAVDSLRVVQTMIEPQGDGSEKRSEALLVYSADEGMERRELFSEITNPAGDYTLDSIIGPELPDGEYELAYAGVDSIDGERTHHLLVTALERDSRHFDGELWISTADLGPVRVVGHVADPPFPVVLITFDKRFAPGPEGLRLLRRHSGEAEVNLLFGVKRGERHIFYDDYVVRVRGED